MFDVAVSLLLDKMMLETSSYRSKLLLIMWQLQRR